MMPLHTSRRRLLKLIGIGTVSGLFFGKFLHQSSIATSKQDSQPSTLALEKLLLESGKDHLPQGLFETTLRHLDS